MRKQFTLLVAVVLLFAISGSAQSSRKRRNTAQAKSSNVKLPEELIQQMARDDNGVKSCLQEQEGNTIKVAEKFSAQLLDLNRDGKPEWIIGGESSEPGSCGFCGNHECSGWIYREVAGRYELLLGTTAVPLRTFTNGYEDLEVGGYPFDGISFSAIYKYDGRAYKKTACYKVTQTRNGQMRRKLRPCGTNSNG